MYRPTVRYDDVFKEYIDSLFHATHLDRNQIIRGALFAAAHLEEFQNLLNDYKKKDVPLPLPLWEVTQHRFWLEQCPGIEEKGGKDVNDLNERATKINKNTGAIGRRGNSTEEIGRIRPTERRTREIPSEPFRIENKGGITIKIN
jgi:hypothetical protein